ncbi:MAG: MATE family efflux transporter [Bacteroidales bacterium]
MVYSFSGYKPHYKRLIELGVPVILGQLAMVLLSFFDTMMVGHYSTVELAAASFITSISNFPLFIIQGMALGFIPIAGDLFGKDEHLKIGKYLKNSIVSNGLALAMALVLMLVFYLCLDKMGQPNEIMPYARPYLVLQWISLPFVSVFYLFKNFTDSITQIKISMHIIIGGVILNIILNYLLIYGVWVFPEMGLFGAGLATLISRVFMAVIYIILLIYKKNWRIYKEGFLKGEFYKKYIKELFDMGWPMVIQMCLEIFSFIIVGIFAGWIGTISLATNQILNTFSMLLFMIYSGLGNAISIRVSNLKGRYEYSRVRSTVYAGTHLMLVLLVFNLGLSYLLRYSLGPIFSDNPEIIALVPSLILPIMLYQIGDSMQVIYLYALRGLGDTKPIAFIALICYMGLSIPISYFLGIHLGYGLFGLWMAFPISLLIAAISYSSRFFYDLRKLARDKCSR